MSRPGPGTRLGPYELLAPLGAGGMGEVWRARDLTLGRPAAVKVVTAEAARDPRAVQRFMDEARAASALNHPNILTIYGAGADEEGRPWIACELVEGETLRALLRVGPLPAERAVEIAAQALAGLARAHEAGIVHRDIKPDNVMVRSDGLVKVLDFGVALLGEGGRRPASDEPSGTLAYMSPEQARGGPVDARSDLFSIGILLHEMLSGAHPFRRATTADTLAALLRDPPPPLAAGPLPGGLAALLERTLSKDPARRPAGARELLDELRSLPPGATASPARAWPAAPRWRWGAAAVLAVVLGALTLAVLGRRGTAGGRIDSLAVLPFENAAGDPESEYLGDGIAESLIYSLSRAPDLKVIARSSAFSYKGRAVDPAAVGAELGVKAVLLGRVSPRPGSVTVSAELVAAADRRQLWGEQYTRPVADLAALQDEIAREIAGRLRLKLTELSRETPPAGAAAASGAHGEYLRGRYQWNKRTDEAIQRAILHFDRALEQDPRHALAYAGLADAYNLLGYRRTLPPAEAWGRGSAAARRALEIDDSLAEAHVSLAFAAFNHAWDFALAEREFRRALELNPSYAHGRHWYSHFLTARGRPAESLRESRLALELDPLDGAVNAHLAWHHYMAREYEASVAQSRRVIELDPQRQVAHTRLGDGLERLRRYEEAIASFRRSVELQPENSEALAGLAHALALAGRRAEAAGTMRRLTDLAGRRYVSAFDVALVHVGLGAPEEALAWLRRALEERASGMVYLAVDPRLDGLRADPRFEQLLREVGLRR